MAKPISNAWKPACSSCLYDVKEGWKRTYTRFLHLISIPLLTIHWHGGYMQRRIVMLPGAVLTLFDSDASELNLNVTSGMGWRFCLNTGQWLYGQTDCCSLQRLYVSVNELRDCYCSIREAYNSAFRKRTCLSTRWNMHVTELTLCFVKCYLKVTRRETNVLQTHSEYSNQGCYIHFGVILWWMLKYSVVWRLVTL